MSDYEDQYAELVRHILDHGIIKEGRNGKTYSTFGVQFTIDELNYGEFPLLNGRKMHYKGVLGELAAFFRGPTHVDDFIAEGCNYWSKWADKGGLLNLDYGNAWIEPIDQINNVIDSIKIDPHGRRHVITGWNPSNVWENKLSLPCCHYAYQWYVTNDECLDMIWIQRSVDTMIGLPSDVILAAAWNIIMAHLTDYNPGRITFQLGDTHIYQEHIASALLYLRQYNETSDWTYSIDYNLNKDISFYNEFEAKDLLINNYKPMPHIDFLLKE